MTENTPAKRRRGAQPGNHNGKGNRGNSHPRPNYGNRGGRGAPAENQFARRKPRSLGAALLPEYQHNAEARMWIEEHLELLQALPNESAGPTDPVEIARWLGLTPESIAENGREFELGLFASPELDGELCSIEPGERKAA